MKNNYLIISVTGSTSRLVCAGADAMAILPTVRLFVFLFNHINHNAYKKQ